MKKLTSLFLAIFLSGFFVIPAQVFADCVDDDGDRYYACDDENDELPPFGKGREEARCDAKTIDEDVDGYELVIAPEVDSVAGNKVHPGAIEPPNSNIDYNCDGDITGYVPEGQGGDTDLFGMVERIITLIGQVAVFVSVGALIYGGIMFATASGEEMKIQKAKKTIIGAVIGLIIGLIAWNIVGFVTDTFGG